MPADLVVDASLAVSPGLGGERAGEVRERLLSGEPRLHAPESLDVEVAHALRRCVQSGDLCAPLLARAWGLRERCSVYDATSVAPTEVLGATLVTQDRRLQRAPGGLVEVLRSA